MLRGIEILSYMAHGKFKSTPEFVVYHGKEMTKERCINSVRDNVASRDEN